MRRRNLQGGFTFVEVLVAVAIVVLLATIVLFNTQAAREKARDAQRISDLDQYVLALKASSTTYGTAKDAGFPEASSGELVGDGVGLDKPTEFLPEVLQDPKHGQAGYGYYYDTNYNCNGTTTVVLVALTMERSVNANWKKCAGTEDIVTSVTPGNDSYVIILRRN